MGSFHYLWTLALSCLVGLSGFIPGYLVSWPLTKGCGGVSGLSWWVGFGRCMIDGWVSVGASHTPLVSWLHCKNGL